uniref:DJ-1/PfpI domain-containing protein n=1 Tax=Megaselia scalaris TaxID=36166 RepID=T1GR11_MEGSC
MSRTACIIIANGIDELELGIIIDILNRADIEYFLVGLKKGEILTSTNVKIQVEKTVDDVLNDSFDVIVLPGGNIATRAMSVSEKVRTILSTQCRNKKLIAASGTFPFILSANNICIGNS